MCVVVGVGVFVAGVVVVVDAVSGCAVGVLVVVG